LNFFAFYSSIFIDIPSFPSFLPSNGFSSLPVGGIGDGGSVEVEFTEMSFAIPWGPLALTTASTSSSQSKTDRDQLEDKIRQVIDGWTEEEQATAYLYLYASGMDLEKAKKIRRRAGFVT